MDRKEEQNQERNGQKEIFAGKVAVVTGASRGIGRAIALELARKGAMVVINYNGSEERAQEVQKCIEEEGNEAAIMQCDVSDFQACEAFFKKVIEQFGRLDILVNNAGITKDGLLMMSFHFLLFKSSRTLVSSAFKPFEKVSMKEMYFPISCLVNSLSSEGNKFKCSFKMVEYS